MRALSVVEPLLDVLEVLVRAAGSGESLTGWAVVTSAKRSGATVHATLDRLRADGWLTIDGSADPRYALTAHGVTRARRLLVTHREYSSR